MPKERFKVRRNIAATLISNESRRVVFNEKEHLVVPVVMLTEGVFEGQGDGGRLYYSALVLANSVLGWNGEPVPVYHPEGDTCNTPEILDSRCIGRLFNTRMDGNKLKSEIYMDPDKADAVYPGLIEKIENGDQIDVSTGLQAFVTEGLGDWNGEEYDADVVAIMPDHLAVLPDKMGACSWNDGCGIRNQKKDTKDSLWKRVVAGLFGIRNADEMSSFDKIRMLESALSRDCKGTRYRQPIIDVYDKYVIYERWNIDDYDDSALYKRNYKIKDNDVELGDPSEVVLEKKYVEVNNNQKEAKNRMSDQKTCCEDRVKALIANEKSPYADKDFERLSKLNEDAIEELEAAFEMKEDEPGTKQTKAENQAEVPKGLDTFDPETQAFMKDAISVYNQQKAEMVTKILAHEGNLFTEDQLKKKDHGELKAILALIPQDKAAPEGENVVNLFDFSLRPTGTSHETVKVPEPNRMPSMKVEK